MGKSQLLTFWLESLVQGEKVLLADLDLSARLTEHFWLKWGYCVLSVASHCSSVCSNAHTNRCT